MADNNKTSWPELEGKIVEEAKQVIQEQYPDFHVEIEYPDPVYGAYMVTRDVREDRVRLFVKENGTVKGTPRVE